MAAILIATPTAGFGDMIRETLEESKRHRVRLVTQPQDALMEAKQTPLQLAIIDADLTGMPVARLLQELKAARPEMKIILIPSLESDEETGITPDGILQKPFYLPDLTDFISQWLGQPDGPPSRPEETSRSMYNKEIERSPVPSPPSRPIGQAQSPRPDAPSWLQDVTRAAQHLTQLSLESSAQAALITKDGSLWAYAGQLPQPAAQELAFVVSKHWDHNGGSDLARFVRLEETRADYMLYVTSLGGNMLLALAYDAATPFTKMRIQAGRLARALSSAPPTESPARVAETGARPAPEPVSSPVFHNPPFPAAQNASREAVSPAAAGVEQNYELQLETEYEIQGLPASSAQVFYQPVNPAVYQLNYSCLMIPRIPQHHLIGDLRSKLGEWMMQLCLAYEWRLEQIAVRPDYFLWNINARPGTSPGDVIQLIARHTSERIFKEFPRYAQENPSGEFWASGHLVLGASHFPPAQAVNDFIAQIRRRQGIKKT